jgi:hypothetical protein
MQQRLAVKRIYKLGDYQNIEITSELTEIPQQIFLNEEAQSKLQYLLLVDVEQSYVKYHEILRTAYKTKSIEESLAFALQYLETEKTQTFNQLSQILKLEGK